MENQVNSVPSARRSRPISHPFGLLAVLLIAAFLRIWHLNWGLPQTYEEMYPFSVAWNMWNWGGAGVELNPHFFNYPALTFYLNFILQGGHYLIGHLLGVYPNLQSFQQSYIADPTVHVLIARGVSASSSLGTVVLLYYIGRACWGDLAGILAALIAAVKTSGEVPMLSRPSLRNRSLTSAPFKTRTTS